MIVVRIMRGLGNQMFQYAAAKSLAISLKKKLYIDTSSYQIDLHREYSLNLFPNINDRQIILNNDVKDKLVKIKSIMKELKYSNKKVLSETYIETSSNFNFFNDLYPLGKDILYLQGYFQSHKYFKKNEKEIKMSFFKTLPTSYNQLQKKMEQSESVSIHFRRGDYNTDPYAIKLYVQCSLDYYKNCIAYIQKTTNRRLALFIFSDDIQWVKLHFPIDNQWDVTFIEDAINKDPATDMLLMSKCRHHITANSTYSYWGAWLGRNPEKIICTPKKWFNKNPNGDLVPNHWIGL